LSQKWLSVLSSAYLSWSKEIQRNWRGSWYFWINKINCSFTFFLLGEYIFYYLLVRYNNKRTKKMLCLREETFTSLNNNLLFLCVGRCSMYLYFLKFIVAWWNIHIVWFASFRWYKVIGMWRQLPTPLFTTANVDISISRRNIFNLGFTIWSHRKSENPR